MIGRYLNNSISLFIFFVGITVLGSFLAKSFPPKNLPKDQSLMLVDPEMSPKTIEPLVMQGFHLLEETKKYAPQYSGDRLNCTNCHFSSGNSFGGEGNGISLVGVAYTYPKTLPDGSTLTLQERINNCFEKSMSGRPLPKNSPEMQAIIAYLTWISSDVATAKQFPWLGLKALRSRHVPDPINGSAVYAKHCALCHGTDGEGQVRQENLSYPPLWGKHSFNEAAGMNTLDKLAPFIYFNMPYEEPLLSIEDALDVASFIQAQPRPQE